MAEETKSWFANFGDIMGGASDVVANVATTIEALTRKAGKYASLPQVEAQAKEAVPVQAEVKSGPSAILADVPWLPIAAVVVVILLMRK